MQFRNMQGLIRINISEPRKKSLVEQQGFELPLLMMKCSIQPLGREFPAKRFGSQTAQHFLRIRCQPDAPEFAGIVENQRFISG